ncbi:hypothetical protein MCEMIH16_01645 [Caulobacteraceae bacterium]
MLETSCHPPTHASCSRTWTPNLNVPRQTDDGNRKPSVKPSTLLTTIVTIVARLSNIVLFAIMTPLLFAGLGEAMFGVYQLTQRIASFGGLTNLGATSYLKIRLNELSMNGSPGERRLVVGECLVQWLALSPVLIVWLIVTGVIIKSQSSIDSMETVGVLILLAITPIAQIVGIPQVAMLSQGVGYRSIPVTTIIMSTFSIAAALAASAGYGILGVSISLLLGVLTNSAINIAQAKRDLIWFGLKWPKLSRVRPGLIGSAGASIASLSYLGLQQAEIIAFGAIGGASVVARLVLTCAGIQVLDMAARAFISSNMYHMSPAIRNQDYASLSISRKYVHNCITVMYLAFLPAVIILVPAIVPYWVNGARLLESEICATIAIVSYIRVISQSDGMLLDQNREFYNKALMSAILVFVPVALTVVLTTVAFPLTQWYWILPISFGAYGFYVSNRCRQRLLTDRLRKANWFIPLVAILSAWAQNSIPAKGSLSGALWATAFATTLSAIIILSDKGFRVTVARVGLRLVNLTTGLWRRGS